MYPISFIYVWTTFEHQVQNLYASQKGQILSSLYRWETRFRHQQGHQRAVANSGSIENIQKTTTAMNSVERQKTVNIGKKLQIGLYRKRFHKNAIRENFNLKRNTQLRKLFPTNHAAFFTNTLNRKGSVSHFLHLCLNDNWAPDPRFVSISKNKIFFESPQATNTFPAQTGPPTSRFNILFL